MSYTFYIAAVSAVAAVLSGCAAAGPAALRSGRSAYNAVINETEDEQILSMIVRTRYAETFDMLAVSNVTANLRIRVGIGANAGIGPRSNYAGNLTPLSGEAIYEENPTISYVPLRGERFLERMLAPVSAEQALLLGRMSGDDVEVPRLFIKRVNGLANPLYFSHPVDRRFDHFLDLYTVLRRKGVIDVVRSSDGEFALLFRDQMDPEAGAVDELLRILGIESTRQRTLPATRPTTVPTTVPLRFFLGLRQPDSVDFETPSALEVIEAAASGVDVPADHAARGIAPPADRPGRGNLVAIHSSLTRPAGASVAVMHRGWWFFVDGTDSRSKRGFIILRTLIGMRLDAQAPGQGVPILTVPVGGR